MKKKIVFGITSLTLGGAEKVLVDLVNKLSSVYDITIFTIYGKGELEQSVSSNVKIVSMYDKKFKDLSKLEKLFIPLKILIMKKQIFKKYIERENYDTHISFLEGPITRMFSVKGTLKAKKIAWVHNDISRVFGKGIKSKLKRIFDRNAYEKYDKIVFVSLDNMDKFNKTFDDILLPQEKFIKNYIDSDRILNLANEEERDAKFENNKINIVQVSRLVEQKAVERLINVYAGLKDTYNNCHIYIVGDGPLKEKLQKRIEELKIQDSFTLLGAKVNPYPYIKNADVFCLLSNFEGYGIVIDEAKILNKNIVITNTAAREAVKDYKKSYIVMNDEKGIEEALKYICEKKYKKNIENSQYVFENEKVFDKIIKIIEE